MKPKPDAEADVDVDYVGPNVARVYDYLLGGKDNYAEDRAEAERLLERLPEAAMLARMNRHFLVRAVRFLVEDLGIRQFVDLGAGLPTVDPVHQVAESSAAPEVIHTVYVDHDPIAVTHGQALLATSDQTVVMQADIGAVGEVFDHPDLQKVIDLNQPVAVLLVSVLHFFPGDQAYELVRAVTRRLAPGSHVVISHGLATERTLVAAKDYRAAPVELRTRLEIEGFFEGLELLDPGVVSLPAWRPEFLLEALADEGAVPFLGGVAKVGGRS